MARFVADTESESREQPAKITLRVDFKILFENPGLLP
jgi:hypothetical protein